jgi:hypothetical protein
MPGGSTVSGGAIPVKINCSYPRCSYSVSAGNLLSAIGLAESMGYVESRDDDGWLCREHSETTKGALRVSPDDGLLHPF